MLVTVFEMLKRKQVLISQSLHIKNKVAGVFFLLLRYSFMLTGFNFTSHPFACQVRNRLEVMNGKGAKQWPQQTDNAMSTSQTAESPVHWHIWLQKQIEDFWAGLQSEILTANKVCKKQLGMILLSSEPVGSFLHSECSGRKNGK